MTVADDVSNETVRIWVMGGASARASNNLRCFACACLQRVHVYCRPAFTARCPAFVSHNTQCGVFVKIVNGYNSGVANGKDNDAVLCRAHNASGLRRLRAAGLYCARSPHHTTFTRYQTHDNETKRNGMSNRAWNVTTWYNQSINQSNKQTENI